MGHLLTFLSVGSLYESAGHGVFAAQRGKNDKCPLRWREKGLKLAELLVLKQFKTSRKSKLTPLM